MPWPILQCSTWNTQRKHIEFVSAAFPEIWMCQCSTWNTPLAIP